MSDFAPVQYSSDPPPRVADGAPARAAGGAGSEPLAGAASWLGRCGKSGKVKLILGAVGAVVAVVLLTVGGGGLFGGDKEEGGAGGGTVFATVTFTNRLGGGRRAVLDAPAPSCAAGDATCATTDPAEFARRVTSIRLTETNDRAAGHSADNPLFPATKCILGDDRCFSPVVWENPGCCIGGVVSPKTCAEGPQPGDAGPCCATTAAAFRQAHPTADARARACADPAGSSEGDGAAPWEVYFERGLSRDAPGADAWIDYLRSSAQVSAQHGAFYLELPGSEAFASGKDGAGAVRAVSVTYGASADVADLQFRCAPMASAREVKSQWREAHVLLRQAYAPEAGSTLTVALSYDPAGACQCYSAKPSWWDASYGSPATPTSDATVASGAARGHLATDGAGHWCVFWEPALSAEVTGFEGWPDSDVRGVPDFEESVDIAEGRETLPPQFTVAPAT